MYHKIDVFLGILLFMTVSCTVSTQLVEPNLPPEDKSSQALEGAEKPVDNDMMATVPAPITSNEVVNGENTEPSGKNHAEVEEDVVIPNSDQPDINANERNEMLDGVNLEGPALPTSNAPVEGPLSGSQSGPSGGQPADNIGNVTITTIIYDGNGNQEPDEHVDVLNGDTEPVQLRGWTIRDEADHVFTFPQYTIQPGETCRIYTNEHHPEWCGFSFGVNSPLWNSSGGCAYLYDSEGDLVSEYCYP